MFFELLRDSIYNIYIQRKRIILVFWGIAISVCMIVVIFSIKSAVEGAINKYISMKYTVSRNITCRVKSVDEKKNNGLEKNDIEKIEKQLAKFCHKITYECDQKEKGQIDNIPMEMVGISNYYMESMDYSLVAGRFFKDVDYKGSYAGMMISETIAKIKYGDPDKAINNELLYFDDDGTVIRGYVVGVFRSPNILAGSAVQETEFTVYCTDVFLNNLNEDNCRYKDIHFTLNDMSDAENYTEYIKSEIESQISLSEYSITVYYGNVQKDAKQIVNLVTIFFLVTTIITFVVAGIGIMNVMLISVRRRTSEIGIMKALGCKNRWIQLQFVIESIIIGIGGEILGLLMGYGIIDFMNDNWRQLAMHFFSENLIKSVESGISFIPSYSMLIISLAYCVMTSIIFGYFPAKKAANLEIVDALRFKS